MPSLLIVPPLTHVLEHELSEVRRRLRIDSEIQYTMDGKTKDYQPRSNRFFTVPQGLPGIVGHMAQLVYDTFYTRRNQGRGSYAFVPDAQLQRRYWERLHFALAAKYRAETGWRTVEEDHGYLLLENANGQRVRATADMLESTPNGTVARIPLGNSNQQQGWYHASGLVPLSTQAQSTARFYFGAAWTGAIPVIHAVTRIMNASGLPYHFKILDDVQAFQRADAAVLYARKSDWPQLKPLIAAIYGEVGPYLNGAVPMFTKPIAPGVGAADDPGDGASFGMSRSILVAEALWHSRSEPAQLADHMARIMQQQHLDPLRPYLNPGSSDYDLELAGIRQAIGQRLEAFQ